LGSSVSKSLSKILLEHLDPPDKPLDSYRQFISSTVSFSVANQSISMLSADLLSKFYMAEETLEEPKYFSIFKEICLSKLESALKKRIILLQVESQTSFCKVHDKRVYDRLQRMQPPETLYFVIERLGLEWKLYEMHSEFSRKSYVPILTEVRFFDNDKSMKVARAGDCLVETIASVLNRKTDHVHGLHCESLRELVFCGNKPQVCLEVGSEFILASHVRSALITRTCNRKLPKHNLFGIHAVYSKDKFCTDLTSLPVVCVTHDHRFYLLGKEYADALRNGQQRTRHQRRESFPGPAGRVFDQLRGKAMAAATAAEAVSKNKHCETQVCPCRGCKNQGKYSKNMNTSGPQKNYTTELSTYDIFRLLGHWSPKVEQDLLNVCRLCIASYDVESMAVPVNDALGNEDLPQVDTVSRTRLPRQIQSVHEPVMIGFTDEVRMQNGLSSLIFQADKDNPDAMIGGFVEAVFEHRDAATVIKHGILTDYFTWLQAYKQAHFQFFVSQGMLPADYCSKWQNFGGGPPSAIPPTNAAAAAAAAANDEGVVLDDEELSWVADLAHRLGPKHDDEDGQQGEDDNAASGFEAWQDEEDREALNEDELSMLMDEEDDAEDFEEEPVWLREEELTPGATTALQAAAAMLKKKEARRIAEIEHAWTYSIFGILEKRLTYLTNCYNVYGFNR
jgi:hypothetical protein